MDTDVETESGKSLSVYVGTDRPGDWDTGVVAQSTPTDGPCEWRDGVSVRRRLHPPCPRREVFSEGSFSTGPGLRPLTAVRRASFGAVSGVPGVVSGPEGLSLRRKKFTKMCVRLLWGFDEYHFFVATEGRAENTEG